MRSYEEIRGSFDSKDGRRPHQRPAYGTGRQRSKRWSTSQHLDDGWSRLKTEVHYEVVSALSCLHACLAAYSNILKVIWILRSSQLLSAACDVTAVEPIRGGLIYTCRLLKQAFSKSRDKTTWEVVSNCEVLWSTRLNTSKVTANRQEDRSSQWEATKKSVGPSTARVVVAHRDRYQRR